MSKKITIEDLIRRGKLKHNNKYIYDKTIYNGYDVKCIITCPIHGDFSQTPHDHLSGYGCPKCGIEKGHSKQKKTNIKFINEAQSKHGYKYDYSETDLGNKDEKGKVCIICHEKDENGVEHGKFWQHPSDHLRGEGCKKCGRLMANKKLKKDTEWFKKEAIKIYGDIYDLSKTQYVDSKTEVCIICRKHGEFTKTPNAFLRNHQGCQKCSIEKSKLPKMSTENFVEKCKIVHRNRYTYIGTEYKGCREKTIAQCPIHGTFKIIPYTHIRGSGCPKCKQSHIERQINLILSNSSIQYEYNTKPQFLNGLEADFYLPNENIVIECQGIQHIIKNHFFEPLEIVLDRDKRKSDLCKENKVKMIYVLSSNFKEEILDKQFNHMYDDALFIEDIQKSPQILIDKLSETP